MLSEIISYRCEVVFPLRDEEEAKDMLLDMILEDDGPEKKTCEIAILGQPTAQAWAEIKVRSIVEKHHPGFADKEPQCCKFCIHLAPSMLRDS